jgi:hypothetical protein
MGSLAGAAGVGIVDEGTVRPRLENLDKGMVEDSGAVGAAEIVRGLGSRISKVVYGPKL